MAGRPLKYKTPEELQKAFDIAFEKIEADESVPTRRYLEYLTDCRLSDYEGRKQFSSTVNRALAKAHALYEQMASKGCITYKVATMYLCQNLGYVSETQKMEIKNDTTINYGAFNDLLDKMKASECAVSELKKVLESDEQYNL